MKKNNRLMGGRKIPTYLIMACALLAMGWEAGKNQVAYSQSFNTSIAQDQQLKPALNKESVMVVGGSMAHGWKDPHDDSYLKRAFAALSSTTDTQYTYVDDTVIGGTAARLGAQKFDAELQKANPQVVAISWGLLNDVSDKTPMGTFRQSIHDEIAAALKAHAVVMVITPPVVEATATVDATAVKNFISNEFQVANSFHNPNVYLFDLNAQMTTYMQAHGQTWKTYYGDSWHPNQAGHVLAGQLLFNDIVQTMGQAPIQYKEK